MTDDEWTVERHLAGQAPETVAMYEQLVALVARCGPFRYAVSQTSITFAGTRRGFAGVRPESAGLRGYLDLQRVVDDPRISSAAPYTRRLFVHQYRIRSADQLDDSFAALIAQAYAVGAGAHLVSPTAHRTESPGERPH